MVGASLAEVADKALRVVEITRAAARRSELTIFCDVDAPEGH
jgi:hypothetical protein